MKRENVYGRVSDTPRPPPPASQTAPRASAGRFPLEDLRFDNANNACQSLRIMAELVRAGDVKIMEQDVKGPAGLFMGSVRLHVIEPLRGRG